MQIILPPHLRPTKKVEDMQSIIKEADEIIQLMITGKVYMPGSKYNDCYATAQPQVSNNPLRYFVINPKWNALEVAFGGVIIVNPRLLSKDRTSRVMNPEGCLSYPFRPIKKAKRFNKIRVKYDIIDNSKGRTIKSFPSKSLTDLPAIVFQHELEHLNGKSIWEK